MKKLIPQVIGALILIAGLALTSIGAHKILTNLPISDEEAQQEATRADLPQRETTGDLGNESQRGNVELQIWKSALKLTNKGRKEKRGEGITFILSGIISLIWGITVLYNVTSTPEQF